MDSLGRSIVIYLVLGLACVIGLGALYSYAFRGHGLNSQAASAVTQVLRQRDLTADHIFCTKSAVAPASVPAAAQITGLHAGEPATLYDCLVTLSGPSSTQVDPTADRNFCVVGFTGSAPWMALDAQLTGCAGLVGHA